VSDPTPLTVVIVLKTAEGGLWVVPHVDNLRQRGHRVVAVLPREGRLRDTLVERGVTVLESAFDFSFRPRPATLRGLWRLRRQIAAQRPDVVYYHLYASALAVRVATLFSGVARVHMVAGPLYLDSRLIAALERRLCRLDHALIAGSAHTAERYRALGLPEARLDSIPYGVDCRRLLYRPSAEQRAQARVELDLPSSSFVVVMVAYVYAPKRRVHAGRGIKGHDLLLDAWRTFRDRHPDVRLLLVGGGFGPEGEAHRAELMARFGVAADPTVRWMSTVEDVRGYYAAADVSVSPSLSDNHGAALEAGGMGVPSIVSDAGGLPETVEPGSGWVVPRDDAAALLDALETAHAEFVGGGLGTRSIRAREWVRTRFERDRCTDRVVDVIERAALRAGDPDPGVHRGRWRRRHRPAHARPPRSRSAPSPPPVAPPPVAPPPVAPTAGAGPDDVDAAVRS
jgi:glycosyltransferase involved in cell wall biosynthesis